MHSSVISVINLLIFNESGIAGALFGCLSVFLVFVILITGLIHNFTDWPIKYFKWLTITLAVALIYSSIKCYDLISNPWIDGGPFTGTPRIDFPIRDADHELFINEKLTLKIFNRSSHENGPTVCMEKSKFKIWCIFVAEEKQVHTSIHFNKIKKFKINRIEIDGSIDGEKSQWNISKFGILQNYWISW